MSRGKMRGVVLVLTTCPNRNVARRLAEAVVRARLAACVNVVPVIHSTFRWQGKVDRCREALLLIKTTSQAFPRLQQLLLQRHPYDVPEVIAFPVAAGSGSYLQWVAESVR